MKNDTKPSISVSDLLSKPTEEVSLEVNAEASNTKAGGDSQGASDQSQGASPDQSQGASDQSQGASPDQSQGATKPDAEPNKGSAEKQEVKLVRSMLTPSNWDIKEYDKERIQAIGGGHNLICTREEFSAILFKGYYTK